MYRSIYLQQFRSYADYEIKFEGGVNIVVGPNGSGKTNLLEALYALSVGSSFRGADRDMVQHGRQWFRLQGLFGEQQRILTCRATNTGVTEKQVVVDGAKKARMTHGLRVPVVLFEPDHLRLLRESPSHRRDYLDHLLIKLQPDFAWLSHQFERVLLQRNNVLKRRLPPAQRDDQLFVWDIKFAELSAQLVARRRQIIDMFAAQLADVYSAIAHRRHLVTIGYYSLVDGQDYQAKLLKQLRDAIGRDHERGFTTVGPHRDDFAIMLNGALAAASASRGETRSLLLALKVIELRLLSQHQDTAPLLLLDDVFSELDATRRHALAELARTHQTLITTTDADAIAEHFLDDYRVITTTLPE